MFDDRNKLRDCQNLVEFFSGGPAVEAPFSQPAAAVLLGNHDLATTIRFAEYVQRIDRTVPIILSGGVGRGTHFLREELALRFPTLNNNLVLAEAEINRLVLVNLGVRRRIYLDPTSTNTYSNLINIKPLLTSLCSKAGPAPIALFQAAVQRRRALVTAEDVLRDTPQLRVCTASAESLRLEKLDERRLTIHLFRLLGWPRQNVEGELPILDRFYPQVAKTIPQSLRNIYVEAESWFGDLLDGKPQLRVHIGSFFLPTLSNGGPHDHDP